MKKRFHINQYRDRFYLNNPHSRRSTRSACNKNGGGSIQGEVKDVVKLDKLAEEGKNVVNSVENWAHNIEYTLKLADEISENELKIFYFGCIESISLLPSGSEEGVSEVLSSLAGEKLVTFVKLVEESREADVKFKECSAWTEQFVSSVQFLLQGKRGGDQEVEKLREQVQRCVERSMSQKLRSEALAKRVEFLEGAVAKYVVAAGVEMGFPETLMSNLAGRVKCVLSSLSRS